MIQGAGRTLQTACVALKLAQVFLGQEYAVVIDSDPKFDLFLVDMELEEVVAEAIDPLVVVDLLEPVDLELELVVVAVGTSQVFVVASAVVVVDATFVVVVALVVVLLDGNRVEILLVVAFLDNLVLDIVASFVLVAVVAVAASFAFVPVVVDHRMPAFVAAAVVAVVLMLLQQQPLFVSSSASFSFLVALQ